MFVRQTQQQFRNSNADVQIFYGTRPGDVNPQATWNKPPGVSHVYMLLIGKGGNGNGTNGGGSGAVTVWYGAAQNVPDSLEISAPSIGGGANTLVRYRTTTGTPTTLLQANGASLSTAGSATPANLFASSGFYQSIAGQNGTNGAVSASSTTFLSGGSANGTTGNYGYTNSTSNRNGFFMLQPIIVGVGGSGNSIGGVGCGGGTSASTGLGGQGMVLIASW